jgi:hypothetical protein
VRSALRRQPGSRAGRRFGLGPLQKRPPMAGFCNSASGLQTPILTDYGAKSSKVSGGSLKYSRFQGTGTGDRVRQHCAVGLRWLRQDRRELGMEDRHARAELAVESLIWSAVSPGELGTRSAHSHSDVSDLGPAHPLRGAGQVSAGLSFLLNPSKRYCGSRGELS